MKDVRFRAWDKKEKKMYQVKNLPLSGYFWIHPESCLALHDGFSEGFRKDSNRENFILMQYIGLKDKNRRDKCHKDIVKDKYDAKYVIEWDNKEACFYHSLIGKKQKVYIENYKLWREHYTEIIGNIYENPEFLKT